VTRIVQLNANARAVLESHEIDERHFLQIDLLIANEDGTESLSRVLVDGEKVGSLADALVRAASETPIADLWRTYV
jgi:hypothetical protein